MQILRFFKSMFLSSKKACFQTTTSANSFSRCIWHKNITSKNPQNSHFSKGFGSKISNFVKVFFYAKYSEKNYLLTLSFEKKPF